MQETEVFVLIVANGYPTKEYRRGIFALDQAKALKGAGHKVAIIALDLRSIRRRRHLGSSRLEVEGIDVFSVSIPLGKVPADLSETVAKAAFRSAYKRVSAAMGKPDVIHAHFYDMGTAAGAVSRDNDIPLVITEHFSGLNRETIPGKLREAAVRSYSNADRLIAVSQSFADNLNHNTGFDFSVVSNVVDTDIYSGICRGEETPDERPFHFVSVGNLVPIKAHDDLLRSFAEALKTGGKDMKLTIVGNGPEMGRLEQQTHELGIDDRVELTGQLDRRDIAKIFKDSDAFVLLSRSETFGVAYIEAMAAGLPVIATACGGPEGFVNETNGIMVPVGDKESHVKALLDMAERSAGYNREKIREETIDRFSPEKIAERLTMIYEELIGSHGA